MNRAQLIRATAACGVAAAAPLAPAAARAAADAPVALAAPADSAVPVAFLLSEGAVVIDFCGPWEVFQDAGMVGRKADAFSLYTVAETTRPIRASGGMKIVPDYDFATAPQPKVLVIPAQSDANDATKAWIRRVAQNADLTMSVCTGAFVLASTGLLAGKSATTHHGSYRLFAMDFPDVMLQRGKRFVEDGKLASAGGLSSGIDLALRVVERYYGHETARRTANEMEYQGPGWLNPASNAVYAVAPKPSGGHDICPVCWMDVEPNVAAASIYRGKSYYFCMPPHKERFERTPDAFLSDLA